MNCVTTVTVAAAESLSYQQAFLRYLEIDPLSADKTQLREVAAKLDLSNVADTEEDRDTLLQLLFTFGVEPNIGKEKQSALEYKLIRYFFTNGAS